MIKEISAPIHKCWCPVSLKSDPTLPPDTGCLETELKYTPWTEQVEFHIYRTGPALYSGLFYSH